MILASPCHAASSTHEGISSLCQLAHSLSTGKQKLRDLGVTTVYDLRSDTEIKKYDTPCPTIEGIDVVRVPVFKLEDYSPEMMAKCVKVRFSCSLLPT